jgi:hypothetical protein
MVLTYGMERNSPPYPEQRRIAQEEVRKDHTISESQKILLFVGAFQYPPNRNAFENIQSEICPLLDKAGFPYKILLCGPGLEEETIIHPSIIVTGFVNDINLYFMAADVFINPVMFGGGIKTKLVEALGNNTTTVSTIEGAFGVPAAYCGEKLFLSENGNWKTFTEKIIIAAETNANIPNAFYEHFYWGYSTQQAAKFIESNA